MVAIYRNKYEAPLRANWGVGVVPGLGHNFNFSILWIVILSLCVGLVGLAGCLGTVEV